MSDPTAIIAKISISPEAKSRFYKEQQKGLTADYYCIETVRRENEKFEAEKETLQKRFQGGGQAAFLEYANMLKILEEKFPSLKENCDPGDLLMIRYDEETKSLFFFLMFAYDGFDNYKTSESLKTLLETVAQYKDTESDDFIFFSDAILHVPNCQFYKLWSVNQGKMIELELTKWNNDWNLPLQEVTDLFKKYYPDEEKYMVHHEAGYYTMDEEGYAKEFEGEKIMDKELLA